MFQRLALGVFCFPMAIMAAVPTWSRGHWLMEDCTAGLEAFQRTVYAKVMKDCRECHDGTNPSAPKFAVEDMRRSYFHLRNYINFEAPERSTLVIRAGNSHCDGKPNCNAESGAEMLKLAKQWWEEGEKTCPTVGQFFTAELELPADLPKYPSTEFKTITWDMSTVSLGLEGTTFTIEVQKFTDPTPQTPGAYLFRKPRLISDLPAMKVTDIKVLINRRLDTGANAYTFVDKNVSHMTPDREPRPFPLFSSDTLIALQNLPEGDKVSISFMGLSPGTSEACRKPEEFTQSVLPHFDSLKCYSCHSGGPAGEKGEAIATKYFSMSLSNEKLCQASRERLNLNQLVPHLSPIAAMPVMGRVGHPRVEGATERYLEDLAKWSEMEK